MLNEAAMRYMAGRGISAQTLERFEIGSCEAIDGEGRRRPAVFATFNATEGTKRQVKFIDDHGADAQRFAWQARDSQRGEWKAGGGQADQFWNDEVIDDHLVHSSDQPLVICEGWMDALSAVEAGFDHAIAIPFGANLPPRDKQDPAIDPDNDGKYDLIWRQQNRLAPVKKIIVATDADPAGRYEYHQLVKRLGMERCHFVRFPDGVKDLNELLQKHGAAAVNRFLKSSKPHPVKGLYSFDEMPEAPPLIWHSTGMPILDRLFPITMTALHVLTGWANSGKSTLLDAIVAQFIGTLGLKVAIGSFEGPVKPGMTNDIKAAVIQKPKAKWTQFDHDRADTAMRRNLLFISSDVADEMDDMSLEDFLDIARIAVLRHDVKLIILDPWNQLEHHRRRDETPTEYTNRAIKTIKRFAKHYQIAFLVVVHPRKPSGETARHSNLYDSADSAHWMNAGDIGGSVYRPFRTANFTEFHNVKDRKNYPAGPGYCGLTFENDHLIAITDTELENRKEEMEK